MEQLIKRLDAFDRKFAHLGGAIKNRYLKLFITVFSLNPKGMYVVLGAIDWFFFDMEHLKYLVSAFILDIGVYFLKRVIGRKRPAKYNSTLFMKLIGLGPDGYSFPSAHTFTSFQLIWVAWLIYPWLALVICFYAVLVATSRVSLKHHHLSDVLAGMVLGSLAGLINVIAW